MQKLIVSVAVVGVLAAAAFAVNTRVDTNGELVNNATSHVNGTLPPTGWTTYATGGSGGQLGTYDYGSSSNVYNLQYETETPAPANPYPAGHSWLLGGAVNQTTAGTWGISQVINTTPGKVYWMTGAAKSSLSSSAFYAFNYGLRNGNSGSNPNGTSNPYQINNSTLASGGRFSTAIVATGTQITANIGHTATGTQGVNDINTYVDGVRIYEMDVPVNSNLVNGNFEAAAINATNYNGSAPVGTAAPVDEWMIPGWLPLGDVSGRYAGYGTQPGVAPSATQSMYLSGRLGRGQFYAFQRINKGIGPVSLNGMIQNLVTANAGNGAIGLDLTGGTNPNAASVTWTNTVTTAGSWWTTNTLSGTASANGITIFLRAGGSATTNYSAYFGANFDNINLTYTPEPASVGLLALGSLLVLRRRR